MELVDDLIASSVGNAHKHSRKFDYTKSVQHKNRLQFVTPPTHALPRGPSALLLRADCFLGSVKSVHTCAAGLI